MNTPEFLFEQASSEGFIKFQNSSNFPNLFDPNEFSFNILEMKYPIRMKLS